MEMWPHTLHSSSNTLCLCSRLLPALPPVLYPCCQLSQCRPHAPPSARRQSMELHPQTPKLCAQMPCRRAVPRAPAAHVRAQQAPKHCVHHGGGPGARCPPRGGRCAQPIAATALLRGLWPQVRKPAGKVKPQGFGGGVRWGCLQRQQCSTWLQQVLRLPWRNWLSQEAPLWVTSDLSFRGQGLGFRQQGVQQQHTRSRGGFRD